MLPFNFLAKSVNKSKEAVTMLWLIIIENTLSREK
jgi:hypothetical protein